MSTSEVISWLLNACFLLAAYGLKSMHTTLKEEQLLQKTKIDRVHDDLVATKLTYVQKDDFKEFKEELFARLDKFEQALGKK